MPQQPVSEQALQDHQAFRNLMDSVLDSSQDGIVLVGEGGKITAVNQAFMNLYGFEDGDLIGADLQHVQQSARCRLRDPDELARFFTEMFVMDNPVIHRSVELLQPESRVISFYSRPVVDRDGKILGRISVHTDISEERKLQQELKELAAFTEICPFPLTRCDRKGTILYMNAAFRLLLDQLHLPPHEPVRFFPQPLLHQISEISSTRAPVDFKGNYDGRFFEFTLVPYKENEEVFVIVNDLTDLKEAGERLRAYTSELEKVNQQMQEAQTQLTQSEKMASLGLLVAGIAHEINTPIGSINSNNDILIRSVGKMRDFLNCAQCPSEVRENPEVIKIMKILAEINQNNRMACERIMNIIRSLKNFARLDEAERKKVNLHDGLDSTLTLVHHQLKNRIQVVKEYGDLPEVECYPNQVNQVFMNLLVNAEQAMPERGTLTIKTFRDQDQIKILISDTGVGIPKENLKRIFDPGFTTKGVGVGTGLGLSICYKIIQDHHGKIEVTSEVGKGTTFTLSLPLQS
jgi:PAS domain S-box-containing protein